MTQTIDSMIKDSIIIYQSKELAPRKGNLSDADSGDMRR